MFDKCWGLIQQTHACLQEAYHLAEETSNSTEININIRLRNATKETEDVMKTYSRVMYVVDGENAVKTSFPKEDKYK